MQKAEKRTIETQKDFWSLEGSLFTKIVPSDDDLRTARVQFIKEWSEV